MNKLLVSLHDSKADTWTPPHLVDTKASALREFGLLVNDHQRTMISNHSADFDLYVVGEFDSTTGTLILCDRLHLANGIDVKVVSDEK